MGGLEKILALIDKNPRTATAVAGAAGLGAGALHGAVRAKRKRMEGIVSGINAGAEYQRKSPNVDITAHPFTRKSFLIEGRRRTPPDAGTSAPATKTAFWVGFNKKAINLATARAAVNNIKNNVIRRGFRISVPDLEKGVTILSPNRGKGLSPIGPITNNRSMPGALQHPGAHGKIFAEGDLHSMLGRFGYKPQAPVDAKNKEMTNRLILLHEQAERKTMNAKDPRIWTGSHHDPKVILQEGNALATLPEGYGATKDMFHTLRSADQTASTLEHGLPGYQYGKTRLSRHAIRRVQELLKEKGLGPQRVSDLMQQSRG